MAPVMPLKDARERQAKALELRGARWTWQAIADELNFRSAAGARLAVSRLLKSHAGPDVSTKRAITVAKLEDQDRRLHPRFVEAVDAGDSELAVKVSKELRSIAEAAARIDGIAAPQQIQHQVSVEVSLGEQIAQARQRLRAIDNTIDGEVIEE